MVINMNSDVVFVYDFWPILNSTEIGTKFGIESNLFIPIPKSVLQPMCPSI